MQVKRLIRQFEYNGMVIPDPNSNVTIAQAVGILSGTYPELATAKIEPPEEETSGGVVTQTTRLTTQAKTKG